MKKVNQELWGNVVDRMTKEETEELVTRFSNIATLNFNLGCILGTGITSIGVLLGVVGKTQIPKFRRWLEQKKSIRIMNKNIKQMSEIMSTEAEGS